MVVLRDGRAVGVLDGRKGSGCGKGWKGQWVHHE